MKRLKTIFACMLMALFSIGQVWADEQLVYTLDGTVTGGSAGYAEASEIEQNSVTWQVMGNTTMNPWRIGGKNLSGVDREVYSTTEMSDAITKVELEVGTASNITVNTLTLIVASDAEFNMVIDEVSGNFVASSTITFEPTSPATQWATGAYYKFVFNVSVSGNSNKFVQFTRAKFYTEQAAPSYTITAQSNDESKGTVSLSGSVITGSPKAGFRYASPAYSVSPANSATVSQNGNAFTVTPSANTTVTINFEAIPQYTVTWNNNGATSTSQVYEGEKPVFPETPAACDATSTAFIGWATAAWEGKLANLDDKTYYTSASAMPAVTSDKTYYAVFAKSSGSASNLFEWAGGSSADLTAEGNHVTAHDLGSDYASGNSPYLVKLDGTGDYIIIDTEAAIGSVEIGVKMIGGANTSSITVQEADSKDAELFTDVETLSISGAQNDVVNLATTNTFASTSRAIKLLFTKGSNVGLGPITIVGAVSYSDYLTTCCAKKAITIASGIENGTVSADPTSACEGATVTLTFTPAGGYHLDSWSLNGTAKDVNTNTFTMPDEAVTVSATFVHDDCTNLLAPTLDGVTKTYNSATIAWNTVTDAVAYAVSVVKDGEAEPVFSGNVNALSKALENLEPETQYNYSIMAIGDGTEKCADGNGLLEGNFTTNPLPTAHLTLMNLGEEHTSSGDYAILTPFNLPTTAAACSKEFVGWDADPDCATAPTYEKGAEFTFANTTGVTLYAVYADGGATEETATVSIEDYADVNSWENANQYTSVSLDENITATASWTGTGNKNTGKYYTNGEDWRFYQGESATITIATAVGELSSVKFTYNISNTGILKDAENNEVESATAVPASGTSAVYHVANSGTATNGQVKFTAVEVKYLKPGTPSNYSTICAAAPEAIVDPEEVNAPAAGVANGVIEAAYENVDESAITVGVFTQASCQPEDAAPAEYWLTAYINGDKNIAYTIAENTTYVARTAYIKLTAPAAVSGPSDEEVFIPVEQAGKATVFASLEDLVAADLASGTEVTVSFSNVLISKDIYQTSGGDRKGVYLNVTAANNDDIEIFYASSPYVPATWVKNGYLSATNLVATWTHYTSYNNDVWELIPVGDFSWENENIITYQEPKAVSSVVVSGEPTKKTYVDGEAFKPAGLTVTVNYTVGDPEVIDAAAADWAFTPAKLAIGNTSVEVVATYNNVSSAAFEVTGLTVNPIPNKTVAEFIAAEGTRCYLEGIVSNITSTTYGNFDLTDASGTIYVYGCLTSDGESGKFNTLDVSVGDKIKVIAEEYVLYGTPAKDEAKNVQFVSKVSAATIDIDDIDMTVGDELLLSDIVATITPDAAQSATINYEVTEGTAVTISEGKIIASTEGEATITASIEAGEGYLAGSTTFTVTVSPAPVPFEGDYFVKVANNSDLTAGEYLIVYEDGSLAFNGGLETLDATSNYVAVTFENGKIQGTDDVLAATFTIKLAGTIQSKSDYYIGRTGNSNGMNTSKDEAYTNAISIDGNGDAVILASGGAYLRYNSADNQKRFRYFQSSSYTGQKAIQLYKKENAEPVYETVRTDLNEGEYYTMCLDKAVTAVQGGTIWKVISKADNTANPGIILEEIEGTPEAGRPYIFNATADKLEVVYNGAAVDDPVTEGNNGLVGSFSQALIAQSQYNYIIYNNALYYVNSDNVYVGANRAYINMTDVPAYNGEPQVGNVQGRRRVVMNVNNGNQMPTGIEGIEVSEAPRKVMIDGQLFILRDKKMYDASGRLVK